MEVFTKYKPYLQEFNYPNISGFSNEQIPDIFSAENRQFLLTWLAKALNSQFVVPTEWSKVAEASFADFFHENGFCSPSQKQPFVKGDASIKQQTIIFDRIFNFLQTASSQKENMQPVQNGNGNEDIELFLAKDINLFPTLGPLKLRTSKERRQKMKYYKEEIQRLKQSIKDDIDLSENDDLTFNDLCYKKEQVEKNIESFKEQAKKLNEVCAAIQKANKVEVAKPVGFKDDIGNKLGDCRKELTTILQYFKDVNVTRSLNTEPEQNQKWLEQGEISKVVKQHAQASYEIVKIMQSVNTS